jgi:hypothetical protein
MAVKLTVGTKEIVPVDIVDRTSAVTDLSGASPKFWFQKDDNSYVYNNASTTAVAMRINPLVDTSSGGPGGLLPAGHYRLFVGFTVGSEVVKLGPIDVQLVET